jgi:DNA repair exonuclease SbcCD ATPase subunit
MAGELMSNSKKIQTALKLSQTDRATIIALQKEVKKAWKQVEINNEKESKSKDVIASMKSELETLKGTYNKNSDSAPMPTPLGAGLVRHKLLELQMEQEEQLRQMTKDKSIMDIEHQTLLNELKLLQNQLVDEHESKKEDAQKRALLEEEMISLKEFLASKKTEQEREARAREKLENSLKVSCEAGDRKEEEFRAKMVESKILKETLNKTETQLQTEKFRSEKIEKDRDLYFEKISRLQQEVDDRNVDSQKLSNINHEQKRNLEARDEELSRLKESSKQITRIKDTLLKKQKLLDDSRMQVELERDTLRVFIIITVE